MRIQRQIFLIILLASASFYLGIALIFSIYLETGSDTLKCKRIQPNQVTCLEVRTKLYDAIVDDFKKSINITGAKVFTYRTMDESGSYMGDVYEVQLESPQGSLKNSENSFDNKSYFKFKSFLLGGSDPFGEFKNQEKAEEKVNQIRRYIRGEGSPILNLSTNPNPGILSFFYKILATPFVLGPVIMIEMFLLLFLSSRLASIRKNWN